MGYSSIVWLPVCAGLTALGLVLSYVVGRRRGYLSMLRGAAWSLLPIAAYLTGSVEMFWKIGVAIGHYADGFVFSPVKWAGIGVAGVSAVLFFTTGGKERRRAARLARKTARSGRRRAAGETPGAVGAAGGAGAAGGGAVRAAGQPDAITQALDVLPGGPVAPASTPEKAKSAAPAKKEKPGKRNKPGTGEGSTPADDDMKDIEEILRKRGI
jgi:hypothetical protein